HARVARTVVHQGVGARLNLAGRERLRNAALDRGVPAQLPPAGNGVQYAVVDVHAFALAEWQLVDDAHHPAMAHVERGWPGLAFHAAAVLREQRVEALRAGAAGVVDRLRQRVARVQADAVTVAARRLDAERVVVPFVLVGHVRDHAEGRIGHARADARDRARRGLVKRLKPVEVPALRSEVAQLHRPLRGDLPLH